jgi:hypothetical protein
MIFWFHYLFQKPTSQVQVSSLCYYRIRSAAAFRVHLFCFVCSLNLFANSIICSCISTQHFCIYLLHFFKYFCSQNCLYLHSPFPQGPVITYQSLFHLSIEFFCHYLLFLCVTVLVNSAKFVHFWPLVFSFQSHKTKSVCRTVIFSFWWPLNAVF